MKAVVYNKYGSPDVLQLTHIEKPTPKDNEVLVKVRATTVTIGDTRMRSFTVPTAQWIPARLFLGIRKPRRNILGMELAGEIAAVGKNVTRFKIGDAIFASTMETRFGGYAEYKCFPEDGVLALKPDNLNYEQAAAAVGAGITIMRLLRQAKIQPGQHILIYGASGALGSNAIQIAKNYYDANVTAVCSTSNLSMVKSLGADHAIDYTKEDFTTRDEKYDVVLDAVAKFPTKRAQTALKAGGIYINANKHSGNGGLGSMLEELLEVKKLIEAGTFTPFIDRCYPLEEIVDAHRYVDKGHKKGNVSILVATA